MYVWTNTPLLINFKMKLQRSFSLRTRNSLVVSLGSSTNIWTMHTDGSEATLHGHVHANDIHSNNMIWYPRKLKTLKSTLKIEVLCPICVSITRVSHAFDRKRLHGWSAGTFKVEDNHRLYLYSKHSRTPYSEHSSPIIPSPAHHKPKATSPHTQKKGLMAIAVVVVVSQVK